MKLSNRERILVTILAIVLVITICIKYVFVPSFENITSRNIEIEELGFKKKEMDVIISSNVDIDKKIENEYITMERSDYFYIDIVDTFVDNLMQDFTEAHSVKIINIFFGEPGEDGISSDTSQLNEFLNNIIKQRIKIDSSEILLSNQDTAQEVTATQPESKQVVFNETILPIYSCTISLNGKADDVINMINDINESNKSIIVTGFSGSIADGQFSGSISLDIYYII